MTPIPAGWKLMPIEPTTEILKALRYAVEPDSAADSEDAAREVWAAMLAAAPATTQDAPITVSLDADPRGVSVGVWQGSHCIYNGAHAVPVSAQDDAKDERPYCYALETRGEHNGVADVLLDVEYNGADSFSHGRKGGFPLYRRAAPAAGDAQELKRKTDLIAELSKIIHNMTVAQQAAWIEWQHGAGAEAGMRWIENGLAGPGHIPEEDEPYGTEAQAYFDANQADPLPACHCGRPSNILHMGNGYCSQEHYAAAIAAQQGKGGSAS